MTPIKLTKLEEAELNLVLARLEEKKGPWIKDTIGLMRSTVEKDFGIQNITGIEFARAVEASGIKYNRCSPVHVLTDRATVEESLCRIAEAVKTARKNAPQAGKPAPPAVKPSPAADNAAVPEAAAKLAPTATTPAASIPTPTAAAPATPEATKGTPPEGLEGLALTAWCFAHPNAAPRPRVAAPLTGLARTIAAERAEREKRAKR